MKKKVLFFFVLFTFLLCLGCKPTDLEAPVLKLNEDIVSWESIPNALKYEIILNEKTIYVDGSVNTYKLFDGDKISIKAVGDGKKYKTSISSNEITYILESFTVTWISEGKEIEKDICKKGTIPTYDGIIPTKSSTEEYSYIFTGWDKEISAVTNDITYTAKYKEEINKYEVIWKSGSDILKKETLEYGSLPSYNEIPFIESTEKYSYKFIGWDKEISTVTSNITYNAVFEQVINKYEVKWVVDNNVIRTDMIEYGQLPIFNDIPVKETTDKYSYKFKSWDKPITTVTCDISYIAIFDEVINQYSISFYDEDGSTLLEKVTVNYGENVVYPQRDPIKNATESHIFCFDKWVTVKNGIIEDDLTNVVKDRNVYASYMSEIRKVTVYILTSNNYGTISNNVLENIEYGTDISVVNNQLYIGNNVIEAKPLDSNAQYTYEFNNWETDKTVKNNTQIIANFNRIVNKYTITWMQDDKVLFEEKVEYGQTPKYKGETPNKPTINEIDYTFNGWSPNIINVTGSAVYHAQFAESIHKYKINFYDEDGITLLNSIALSYGETAKYNNALPTKQSNEKYDFTFEKWVTEINGTTEANLDFITKDINVYAKYTFKLRKYLVTFVDQDGSILKEELVEYGKSTLPPIIEDKDTLKFEGWDKSFNNITCDVTIIALYIQQYTVTFINYDNSIICEKIVYSGNKISEPNIIPEKYKSVFVGWYNTDLINKYNFDEKIYDDIKLIAKFEDLYSIKFYNFDNTLIEEKLVKKGEIVTAPIMEDYNEYVFASWDKNYDNITTDLIIYAKYVVKTYTVKFVMPDGKLISEESIEYGQSAHEPIIPDFYYDKINHVVKSFTKWDTDFSYINNNLIIKAIYESPYNKPAVVIEYDTNNNNNPSLYICFNENYIIYGFTFTLDFSTTVGNIIITKYNINEASDFKNLNESNILNNNEKYIKITFADKDGKIIKKYTNLLEKFEISLDDGAVINEHSFKIKDNVVFYIKKVSSEDNNPTMEIIPEIIYIYK